MSRLSDASQIGKTLKHQRVQALLVKVQNQISLDFHQEAQKTMDDIMKCQVKNFSTEVAFQVAECLYKLRKYKTCLALLEEMATDETGKMPMIQNMKGQCQMRLGNVEKAIDHFEICLVIDPKFKVASNNLGNIYMHQKDYIKSKHYFEKSKQCKSL